MNENLKTIFDFIQQNENLTADEKDTFSKAVKEVDKELTITTFKLDRTEKVKRTTAILLEETIEELEQKRKAVEAQNHELEIESSLERVRSVAMGMQNPAEMVDVCKIISEQLEFLKVKDIRNVQTAVIYESKGTYINYEYYTRHNKLLTTEVSYKTHHLQEQFANQMLKGAGEFFSPSLEGQQVKDWYEYQKTTNQFADSFLEGAQTLNYYMFSLGPVALGISTYSPLKEEEINLFKRFRNVFELAYRRFLDIQKAEAQAREAQIELALERVRARAMAMYNSTELAEVATLLFEQLKHLGVESYSSGFNIWDKEHKNLISWMSNPSGSLNPPFEMPIRDFEQHKRIYTSWEKHKSFMEDDIKGKALIRHYKFLRSFPLLDESFKIAEEAGIKIPDRQVHNIAFFSNGYLLFITLQPCEQNHSIFKRFAKVFEQTYTRFLDLQKAEAQAREAQIESAVERVRAKSMGMYQTSDLYKVNEEVLNQLYKLKVDGLTGVSIYLVDENDTVTIWDLSSPGNMSIPNSYSIKYNAKKYPILGEWVEIWKSSNQDYFVFDFPKEKLLKAIEEFKEIHPEMANNFKNAIESGKLKHQWSPAGRLSDGLLSIDLMTPPSEDTKSIVIKMAGAFNMAYQRFLDLQKAEAQARESQIQLALERVRARTMAMQKSDELSETVTVLFHQFTALGEKPERMAIEIVNEKENIFEIWATQHGGSQMNQLFKASLDEPHVMQKMYKAWEEQTKSITIDLQGRELEEYFQYLKKEGLPVQREIFGTRRIQNVATFSKGILTIITPEPKPQVTIDLLERFAAVFDGT
ncbi:MAG: hypothetical protein Q8R96_15175, partial [Bacteroidota bacterium]|nr:hypothetical protein [Bacteroidota bacterium]